ncbi:MAG: nitroreductase family protein [Clostridia bacterium]|nr:nitroreductase family protein [Clostridia bacterium]MBQ2690832.1 nitroreductase family protein [Clostridia bacterium]MBQ3062740.1 nitroreductase family protein [Clostridia bacterium]MBQ9966087.1 nitroreductase family protein [Clostridia bacterium]
MDFLQLSHDRWSVRKFSDKPVEQEKIDKIIESAMAAPTACNWQPFKIWVFQSPEAVAKLADATSYTFGAKLMFLIGGDPEKAWVRKFDKKSFADVDASIVATHMMLEIHDLGLGTTWVGAFNEAKLKAYFPQLEGYQLIALFPTGYIAEDAEPSKLHLESKAKEELVTVL